MDTRSLRSQVIRLAAMKPELRAHLLPIIVGGKTAMAEYRLIPDPNEPEDHYSVKALRKELTVGVVMPDPEGRGFMAISYFANGRAVGARGKVKHGFANEDSAGDWVWEQGPLAQNSRNASSPLQVGRTILSDNGLLRIHRYRGSVSITDLTFAGKRGKSCSEFTMWDTDMIRDSMVEAEMERVLSTLAGSHSYQAATLGLKTFVLLDSEGAAIKPKFEEREVRGVDVTPAGFTPIVINTKNFNL